MSEFEIEDGVPIPLPRSGGKKPLWPWPEMEVNQSVFIPAIKGEDAKKGSNSIYRRVNPYLYAARSKKEFTMRWMKHEGKVGVRVWRTE